MTVMVKLEHARAVCYCARGMRRWFEFHGLDWTRFLSEGLTADELRATGDDMALRVVAVAEAENGQ